MTASYTEPNHAGEFVITQEDDAQYSVDAITLASGNNLLAGAVLGKVVSAATATPTATVGNTGNGSIGTVTASYGVKPGRYVVKITKAATDAGEFEVIDPDGDLAGVGAVGAAFAGGGLAFTLADGSADFIVGDTIKIEVTALAYKYVEYDGTATNGAQTAAGVLWADTDATSADADAVAVVRLAIVNAAKLAWNAAATSAQKAVAHAQMGALGIVVR